jgi:hypothetical protein
MLPTQDGNTKLVELKIDVDFMQVISIPYKIPKLLLNLSKQHWLKAKNDMYQWAT